MRLRTRKPVATYMFFFSAALGSILVGFGAWGLYDYLSVVNEGQGVPSSETVTTVTERPSERKPDQDAAYEVPATHPRTIRIDKLGVTSFIQPVGVEPGGAMATPNNIYFTGWYVNSPAPGEQGVSILNGHVGGRYNPGIFKDLRSLVGGDTITVEMGNRSVREFKVTSVEVYPLEGTVEPLFRDNPGIEEELHIITCDGVYDEASQTYDQRVIVVAERIQ